MLEITDPAVIATSGKTHHPILRRTGNPADQVEGSPGGRRRGLTLLSVEPIWGAATGIDDTRGIAT
jgi:hypothetical protein